MSKLKDIQKQLSDVDMSDPKAMLESFGVDYDELEKIILLIQDLNQHK